MRRMMHAAALLIVFAPQIQAQNSSTTSNLEAPQSLRSNLTQSAEVHDPIEMGQAVAKPTIHQQSASGTQIIPRDFGRSYSQLANYMSCNDWSPNLWNNYACERAAVVAHISQHVDMQCKCFESHHRLHADCSGCGSFTDTSCKDGSGSKRINRYRQPISTLYAASSGACNASCSTSAGCGTTGACSSNGNAIDPSFPASAMRPIIANPPRDRVASPVVNSTKASFSVLNAEPSYANLR